MPDGGTPHVQGCQSKELYQRIPKVNLCRVGQATCLRRVPRACQFPRILFGGNMDVDPRNLLDLELAALVADADTWTRRCLTRRPPEPAQRTTPCGSLRG